MTGDSSVSWVCMFSHQGVFPIGRIIFHNSNVVSNVKTKDRSRDLFRCCDPHGARAGWSTEDDWKNPVLEWAVSGSAKHSLLQNPCETRC